MSDGRLLVSPGFDPVSQKSHLRLLGGQVEFGERSEETLMREMREELGAEVEVICLRLCRTSTSSGAGSGTRSSSSTARAFWTTL